MYYQIYEQPGAFFFHIQQEPIKQEIPIYPTISHPTISLKDATDIGIKYMERAYKENPLTFGLQSLYFDFDSKYIT